MILFTIIIGLLFILFYEIKYEENKNNMYLYTVTIIVEVNNCTTFFEEQYICSHENVKFYSELSKIEINKVDILHIPKEDESLIKYFHVLTGDTVEYEINGYGYD